MFFLRIYFYAREGEGNTPPGTELIPETLARFVVCLC